MFDTKIGLIIPTLNSKKQALEFVSINQNQFEYPTIEISDNDILNIIHTYLQDELQINIDGIRPFLFDVFKKDQNIDILYLIRLYPDTTISQHYLLPLEISFVHEYIQKALLIF